MAEVLDRLLERQFLLSPWVREKRLRNQLRLVLKVILEVQATTLFSVIWKLDKSTWYQTLRLYNSFFLEYFLFQDHLEAGPVRRSTVTKVVHDAHQVLRYLGKDSFCNKFTFCLKVFPIWRTQIRETVS